MNLVHKRREPRRGIRRNPVEHDNGHSPALKTALWVSAIVSIVGGAVFLVAYLWPSPPPERLFFRGIVFDVTHTNGLWTSEFAYGNTMFSVNGESRDDAVAKAHDQIDLLTTRTA